MKNTVQPIIPTTQEETWDLAQKYYCVGFVKKSFKNAEEVFFVINLSLELGLSPAQGIQNIAIIRDRATVWGDLLLAIVHGSGLLEKHIEEIKGELDDGTAECVCTIKRKGFDEKVVTFSTNDAKRACLWKYKKGTTSPLPWAAYPLRMLTMRARTFALRDSFPDVLKGLTSKEEAMDIPEENVKEVVINYGNNKKNNEKSETNKQEYRKEEPKKVITTLSEGKDENIEQEPSKKTKIHRSELFNESYVIAEDGSIHFESGLIYSKQELNDFNNMSEEEKLNLHEEAKKLLKEPLEGNLYIKIYGEKE